MSNNIPNLESFYVEFEAMFDTNEKVIHFNNLKVITIGNGNLITFNAVEKIPIV